MDEELSDDRTVRDYKDGMRQIDAGIVDDVQFTGIGFRDFIARYGQ